LPTFGSNPDNNDKATRRVLLLEDDLMLQMAVKEYLESHFYDVVAVANGVEGVKAVMSDNFDIVICDMMMPKLPGDMFHAAVERLRPELCARFIFITGHRGNPKINDFIKQVRGTILTKPFRMESLIDAIAVVLVQARSRRY
jgi:CheY-like chemotaxis protein